VANIISIAFDAETARDQAFTTYDIKRSEDGPSITIFPRFAPALSALKNGKADLIVCDLSWLNGLKQYVVEEKNEDRAKVPIVLVADKGPLSLVIRHHSDSLNLVARMGVFGQTSIRVWSHLFAIMRDLEGKGAGKPFSEKAFAKSYKTVSVPEKNETQDRCDRPREFSGFSYKNDGLQLI